MIFAVRIHSTRNRWYIFSTWFWRMNCLWLHSLWYILACSNAIYSLYEKLIWFKVALIFLLFYLHGTYYASSSSYCILHLRCFFFQSTKETYVRGFQYHYLYETKKKRKKLQISTWDSKKKVECQVMNNKSDHIFRITPFPRFFRCLTRVLLRKHHSNRPNSRW